MQYDRRRIGQVAGAHVDEHDGQPVVLDSCATSRSRDSSQPFTKPAAGLEAVQRGRVVGDEALGKDALVHPAQGIERSG